MSDEASTPVILSEAKNPDSLEPDSGESGVIASLRMTKAVPRPKVRRRLFCFIGLALAVSAASFFLMVGFAWVQHDAHNRTIRTRALATAVQDGDVQETERLLGLGADANGP